MGCERTEFQQKKALRVQFLVIPFGENPLGVLCE